MSKLRTVFKLFIPPILFKILKQGKAKTQIKREINELDSGKQDLEMYWDPEYAKVLEEWGMDNTWNEIQMILATAKGKVLDIACGTGVTIKLLERFPDLELHGFDISDFLIKKAINKGISGDRLKVLDATETDYQNNEFDYSYSIGSLEHFTEDGIEKFIQEAARITKTASFHMIPVSRSDRNEGWMKTVQSFFNNSEIWWHLKFKSHFRVVYIISSKWEDQISYGKWFICVK